MEKKKEGEYLRSLREEAVTYGRKYVHVADLESFIYGLVEHYTVVQGSKYDTSTSVIFIQFNVIKISGSHLIRFMLSLSMDYQTLHVEDENS